MKAALPPSQQRRLQAHFGFTGLPFRKNVVATKMFDSESQRELRHGLLLWLELRGLGLLTGPSGAGKSISLRRFVHDLPSDRYKVHRIGQIPTTPTGFMRGLTRRLGLRPRAHLSDMFDEVQQAFTRHEDEHGTHPVLLFDDSEGMRVSTLDLVRRLTACDLDSTDHVSILLAGTEELIRTLQAPSLLPLRSRFCYAHSLRTFGLDDARNYVRFHLRTSGGNDNVFNDVAVKALFHASQGVPRQINQLALQALVDAVVHGVDQVDGAMMRRVLKAHPLYATGRGS